MTQAVPVAAADSPTPSAEPAPAPTEQTLTIPRAWIRCRPGRARNYCGGTGVTVAIVDGRRVKRLCACIEASIREAKAAKEAQEAAAASVAELVALADGLTPPPAEPTTRHVPVGARVRHEALARELAKETARHAAILEETEAATTGVADELAALTAEEVQNRRDMAAAEGTKLVAGAQREELRARLAGLNVQVEEAEAAIVRLRGAAGQFGARRMQAEAALKAAKGGRVKDEKLSADRVESLEYRLRQHLARWPELAEVATS